MIRELINMFMNLCLIIVYFLIYFLAPRSENKRSWLYRIRPSVIHEPFVPVDSEFLTYDWSNNFPNPNQVNKSFLLILTN